MSTLRSYSRADRRAAEARERRGLSGRWEPWTRSALPHAALATGWARDVTHVFANGLYAVLVRPVAGGVTHLAIRTATSREPPWRDLQRIKNELFGPERFAVQVCPPQSRLIDEADMYHLWIMPEGHTPGFGLHPNDEGRPRPAPAATGSATGLTRTPPGPQRPHARPPRQPGRTVGP